ncbi:MAG: response regulator transcription factor [Pseudomonadota bacterium]
MRLLIADDDEVFARVLGEALERKGYDVAVAHHAEDIVNRIRDFESEYVLLDLMMGQTSTMSLIPDILSLSRPPKVIVLTGYASVASTVQALKLGASNYLAKPVGVLEVIATLEGDPPSEADDLQPMPLHRVEWEHIQRVLAENDGNISATARALGLHRRTLQRKLEKRPSR